jgi:acyl-CoA synthetase (AMP-forming)/AMP-acid ligase II
VLSGQREPAAALRAAYIREGFWPGRLITEYFEAAVRTGVERRAIVDDRTGAVTYGRLAEEVERLTFALRELGVSAGDFFILQLPNWYEFAVFHLALTYAGAITVNVPVSYRRHELRYIAGVTGAMGIAIPAEFRSFDFVAMVEGLGAELPGLRNVIVVGDRAPRTIWRYQDVMAKPWESGESRGFLAPRSPHPDAVTGVSFTSGTTGEPKGVMHTSNTFAAINVSVARAYGLTADDVIFMPSPLGHSIGLMHGLRLALFLGARLVLQGDWDPAAGIGLMVGERASFTVTAPPLLHDLVGHPALPAAARLPSLRVYLCGGAFVPERLLRAARAAFPSALTTALWGMTEGIGTSCRLGAPLEKLFTTDGEPFPGTELRVVAPDGREVGPGEDGELVMRGPQLFVGYFRRPDLNEAAFLPDGFFRTGDLARTDREGYVNITGRLKEIIVRGGVNISPVEIERVLAEDRRIERVAVVGMPDERLGERICAFVVPRRGAPLTLEDLAAIAESSGLSKQKWPERLEIVSDFPVTASGKVQRHVLRQRLMTSSDESPRGG